MPESGSRSWANVNASLQEDTMPPPITVTGTAAAILTLKTHTDEKTTTARMGKCVTESMTTIFI